MKLDMAEFPTIGEDFDIVTIDLMSYTDGAYTPMINYMFANDETETVDGGLTLLTGMSFDSYQAAAIFFNALIQNGFFIVPVSRIGFIFSEDGDMIEQIDWEDYANKNVVIPSGVSIH